MDRVTNSRAPEKISGALHPALSDIGDRHEKTARKAVQENELVPARLSGVFY